MTKGTVYFAENNIRLMCLELPTTLMNVTEMGDGIQRMMFDTVNNMMIELFASMAHAEMEKRQKRQREGIAEMKKRGEWAKYGRPQAIESSKFALLYNAVINGEKTRSALMRELNISHSTFYRLQRKLLEENKKSGDLSAQVTAELLPLFSSLTSC